MMFRHSSESGAGPGCEHVTPITHGWPIVRTQPGVRTKRQFRHTAVISP
jgi:hypothetical protein